MRNNLRKRLLKIFLALWVVLVWGSNSVLAQAPSPVSEASQPTKIAFTAESEGQFQIYVVAVDGSARHALTWQGNNLAPAWSPDGKTIAYISDRDGQDAIYLMDSQGNNQRRLTNGRISQTGLAWSPDGKTIAYISDRDGQDAIYLMDSQGNNQRRLTHHLGLDSYPTWSADGKHIAFARQKMGRTEI